MTGTNGASPLNLVHRLWQEANAIFAKQVQSKVNITERRLAILLALKEADSISQRELCRRTGIDRSTISTVLRCLDHAGLISRARRQGDARSYMLSLTPAGEALVRKARPLAEAANAEISELLPPKAWKDVAELLDRYEF